MELNVAVISFAGVGVNDLSYTLSLASSLLHATVDADDTVGNGGGGGFPYCTSCRYGVMQWVDTIDVSSAVPIFHRNRFSNTPIVLANRGSPWRT